MKATLYVIPASHPAMTARRMLEAKGISYKRVDLMPVISKAAVRVLRFPGITVPALKIDGRRVQGSREIAHELDRLVPEPPLYPAEPGARAAVEEAERWGDEELQAPVRRILWNGMRRNRAPLASYAEGAKLGVPIGLAVRTSAPIVALAARMNDATDDAVRADIAALPSMVDTVDAWFAEGVLGGDSPNAADLQIAASLRLAMTLADLRQLLEGRPAGDLAMKTFPDYPGEMPPVFPSEWLEPLRPAAPPP